MVIDFFFHDTATTDIYTYCHTLSLHDALPIAPAAQKLKAFSITSSAFYWPFPFADGEPSSYVHDSRARDQLDTFQIDAQHAMDYRAWNFTQEDNFCRVDLDPRRHSLQVAALRSEEPTYELQSLLHISYHCSSL